MFQKFKDDLTYAAEYAHIYKLKDRNQMNNSVEGRRSLKQNSMLLYDLKKSLEENKNKRVIPQIDLKSKTKQTNSQLHIEWKN